MKDHKYLDNYNVNGKPIENCLGVKIRVNIIKKL